MSGALPAPCYGPDAGTRPHRNGPAGTPVIATMAYPRATLAATILGSSLAFVDGSMVNVALLRSIAASRPARRGLPG